MLELRDHVPASQTRSSRDGDPGTRDAAIQLIRRGSRKIVAVMSRREPIYTAVACAD